MVVTVTVLTGLLGPIPVAAETPSQSPSRPVLLVGGTFTRQWAMNRITFLDDEFDVYSVTLSPWLGMNGVASMATSAQAVEAKVAQILDQTGAKKVDLVGHSQGAPVIRYYVKFLGGLEEVGGVVSLGGINYGIPRHSGNPLNDLITQGVCALGAPVCPEVLYDDDNVGDTPFLRALNEPDPTPGNIDYYHFWTTTDESDGGVLPGGTNVIVQDMCPGREVYHVEEWEDEAMQALIRAALKRELAPHRLPACPA